MRKAIQQLTEESKTDADRSKWLTDNETLLRVMSEPHKVMDWAKSG